MSIVRSLPFLGKFFDMSRRKSADSCMVVIMLSLSVSQPSHQITSAVRTLLCCLLSLGLLAPWLLWADERDTYAHHTLQNLRGVNVLIEPIGADLLQHEWAKTQVKDRVVQQLRQAGIQVLTQEEWLQTQERPTLYVRVVTQQGFADSFVIMVQVELWQAVSLLRDPSQVTMALTWRSPGAIGSVRGNGTQLIEQAVHDEIKTFIQDYRAMNVPRNE